MKPTPVYESIVKDDLTVEAADLASIWADLMLVSQSLNERKRMTSSGDLFVRRALWEQAVIAYARCFRSGRRRKLPDDLKAQMAGDSERVHDEILRWADKHVAHRVDQNIEATTVSLTYLDSKSRAPTSVRIRVDVPVGPKEERLANALQELAQTLKDRLWEQWFPPLESALLEKYYNDKLRRSGAASYEHTTPPGKITFTINPTSRGRDDTELNPDS